MRAEEQKQNAKNHLKAFSPLYCNQQGLEFFFREQHFLVISFHVFPRHLIVASSPE
jgi:hypothetical protein